MDFNSEEEVIYDESEELTTAQSIIDDDEIIQEEEEVVVEEEQEDKPPEPTEKETVDDETIKSVAEKINRSVERNKRNPREFQLVEQPCEEKYNTGKPAQGQRTKRRYTKRKGIAVSTPETIVTETEILEKLGNEKSRLEAHVAQPQPGVLQADNFEEKV